MLIKPSVITSSVAGLAIPFSDQAAQAPLGSMSITKGISFSVSEQNESICNAGSRQWTGWANISNEKSLFFCMTDFRDLPLHHP
jgi:hypothetical protein